MAEHTDPVEGSDAVTSTAGPRRRVWWIGPRAGVLAITAGLLGVVVLAWARGLAGIHEVVSSPRLAWWALVPLFVVAEVVVVHVQVRREAQAVSLSEIPLVLALFLTTPSQMLITAVLGSGLVYVLHRRQSPIKALFNIVLRVFGVTLALGVFDVLAGRHPVPAQAPEAWLAAIIGVAMAGAADGLLVLAVVGLHDRTVHRRDVVKELFRFPAIAAAVACIGVLTVTTLNSNPRTGPLLLVGGAALFAGYRAHAALTDRHVSLSELYDFGHAITGAHAADDILASALTSARNLLRAEAAEVVLLGAGPADPPRRWLLAPGSAQVRSHHLPQADHPALWTTVLASGQPQLHPRMGRNSGTHSGRRQLAALGYRDAIVVPLRNDTQVVGSLLVGARMGEVRTFQAEDIPTLEAIATQAGLVLAKERLLSRMQHEATHDVLTGLANRAMFRAATDHALAQLETGNSPGLAVLLIDLDGFKEVNDSLGHHQGDALLVHVATTLTGVATPLATVARLGGDEFAIVLPDAATVADALAVAEQVHHGLAQTVVIEDIDVQVRASIGIALAPGHARDVSGLLRAADTAMYRAKHDHTGTQVHDATATSGHSQTTTITRTIGRQAAGPASPTTLSLLADLRKGIVTGEITIHVQPQARTDTGHVFAAEALIRWNHPQLGVLSPAQFLPLAERHGLMHDLTALVLDQSAAAAAAWHATGLDLGVSVNLPPRSLLDNRTLPIVQATLDRYRLPPARLTLEITEDSVITDPATAIALLARLRSVGVRLSVDDFGTGYSSLSYLRQLPVNEVKIDRSFVSHITRDTHDQIITRAIVDLGTSLAMDVVAEGIETQDTWDHLANLGCHAVQGYHLAKPMPVDHLEPWLHGYATQRRAAVQQARPRLHAI